MDSPRAPLYSPQSTTPSHLGRIEEEPRGRVWGSGLARKDAHRSSRHLRKRSVEDIGEGLYGHCRLCWGS